MRLSIVTVTKSPAPGFEATYASVLREFGHSGETEYLIKAWDGESDWEEAAPTLANGGSLSIRRVKGRDAGVFDAMNQCIEAASGEWIVFLNAGDWWAPGFAQRLFAAMDATPDADFIYFDGVTVDAGDRREFLRKAPKALTLRNFDHHVPILHPCLIVRRFIMADYRFDLRYDLAADFDLMVRFVADGLRGHHVAAPGACVISGGLSETHRIRARRQATLSVLDHSPVWADRLRVRCAFFTFLAKHFLIAQVIHRIPALQRRARRHSGGQPPGTYGAA